MLYFDGIIKIEEFGFDNILIDEKLYENVLVYNISYITLIGVRSHITEVISRNSAKMKVDPCDRLKTLNLHYVIIFIKFLIKIKVITTTIYF